MKNLIFAVAAILAVSAYAATPNPAPKAAAPTKPAEAEKEPELVKVDGEGSITIVNAGGVASNAVIDVVAKGLDELFMATVKTSNGSWSLATADKATAATKSNAAIFVVKDPVLPISLIALESRWAVVNATGLSEKAIQREIVRVAVVLLGGCYSQYDASVMGAAFTREDLEKKIGDAPTIDVLLPVLNNVKLLGIKPYTVMTREEAVEAGLMK